MKYLINSLFDNNNLYTTNNYLLLKNAGFGNFGKYITNNIKHLTNLLSACQIIFK